VIDLYAVQFETDESSTATAQKQTRTTIELVERWIETAYKRQFGSALTLPPDDFSLDPHNGRLISRATQQTSDGSSSITNIIFTKRKLTHVFTKYHMSEMRRPGCLD
jgi:hypothetical protein